MGSGGSDSDVDVVNRSDLFLYGSVGFPLAVIGYPLAIFLPPFYSDELGISVGLVGLMLFVARVTDVFTDPMIGILSDRVRTRWGRRKPWMMLGVPVMLLGIVMVFMPRPPVDMWYLLIWVAVMFFGWTLITLPYGAWGAELSLDYHQRSRITAYREGFVLAGLFCAAVVPALIQSPTFQQYLMEWMPSLRPTDFEGNAPIMYGMGLVMLVALPATVFLAVGGVNEPPPRQQTTVPWKKGLRLLWDNRPFKRVVVMLFVVIAGTSFRNSLSVFFMTHVIEVPQHVGKLFLLYFGVSILAIPYWLILGGRIGKHRAFCLAMVAVSLGEAPIYFLGPGDLVPFAILFSIKGFCFGAFQFLPLAMLADIVDLDTVRGGEQRTGLIFAAYGIVSKSSRAVGVGLSLVLLELAAFNAQGHNGPLQLMALRVYYVLTPILFFLLAGWIAWDYSLTEERQARLRRRVLESADSPRTVPTGE